MFLIMFIYVVSLFFISVVVMFCVDFLLGVVYNISLIVIG